ncbi:MAG TPA: TIGR03862 family flavoprotein [Anaerolineales bacterium]|nr:TIGR03862 family flavoprotein [Anaerolineales bacterium]
MNAKNVPRIAIIGAGPAGLICAETLLEKNMRVDIYDSMPSAGAKFLLAGRGGLNLTHSESYDKFISRYGDKTERLKPYLDNFNPDDLRKWASGLGIKTFVGSSGRVFPEGMGAMPLLDAWLARLMDLGASFHFRHRWLGWGADNALRFSTAQGDVLAVADGVALALGGGSKPKTGSDAAWIPLLEKRGVPINPLKASNCGFDIHWSEHIKTRFAGVPIKTVKLSFGGKSRQGEFVLTENGVEGSLIYAFSASLRNEIEAKGNAEISLDLLPDTSAEKLAKMLSATRGSRSVSSFLKKRTGLSSVKTNLIWEVVPREKWHDLAELGAVIKALPLVLVAPRPLEEAISSAGGVSFEALDENLMLKNLPGVFCAGEMLDWEAPTGGYLLTASFATGRAVGQGILKWTST